MTIQPQPNSIPSVPMPSKQKRKSGRRFLVLAVSVIIVCMCLCVFSSVYQSPLTQASKTAVVVIAQQTNSQATELARPTETATETPLPTPTAIPTLTPTATETLIPETATVAAKITKTAETAAAKTATQAAQIRALTATSAAITATANAKNAARTATQSAKNTDATATSEARATIKADKDATATTVAGYKEINWRELSTYADDHVGERVIVRGVIFNVISKSDFQIWFTGTYEPCYISMLDKYTGIYKDTSVTVYGIVVGTSCGENAFGGKICQPSIMGTFFGK